MVGITDPLDGIIGNKKGDCSEEIAQHEVGRGLKYRRPRGQVGVPVLQIDYDRGMSLMTR